MTQVLSVSRKGDFHFEITDQYGKTVEGPFDTNAAAWKALDRVDNVGSNRPPERVKPNKKVLWGKPEKKSKKAKRKERQQRKLTPAQEEHRLKVNAGKAVGWIRSGAMGKFDPAGERAYRDYKLGTFGPASEVKRIDPAVYLAEKAARGEL
jgi:acyl-CoA synthetase (AMP-forming)/AMP-acid ligase II